MADVPVVFTENTGQRILAAVRYVESIIRGGGPGRGKWPVGAGGGAIRTALTPSGGIPALSGTTAGSATCTFYAVDGANCPLGTETATVYNDFITAVTGSRKIKVHWEGGAWRFLVMSCS